MPKYPPPPPFLRECVARLGPVLRDPQSIPEPDDAGAPGGPRAAADARRCSPTVAPPGARRGASPSAKPALLMDDSEVRKPHLKPQLQGVERSSASAFRPNAIAQVIVMLTSLASSNSSELARWDAPIAETEVVVHIDTKMVYVKEVFRVAFKYTYTT